MDMNKLKEDDLPVPAGSLESPAVDAPSVVESSQREDRLTDWAYEPTIEEIKGD